VTLPLLIAIGSAAFRLGQLTRDSEAALNTAAESTVQNRRLDTLLINMERNARQFLVLDPERSARALALYREDELSMRESLVALSALPQATAAAEDLRLLAAEVDRVDELLLAGSATRSETSVIDAFRNMDEAAARVDNTMRAAIDEQLTTLRDDSARAQRMLGWQAAALVPLTILLAVFFLLLIVRPMRKIDRAIREIGSGDYSRPIEVTGPADIQALSRQLEWLRDRLEESANEKNKFLRHMSHELKTPLANIREGSELLMDGSVGALAHEQEEVADILRLNSIKLQRLIENLLTYSTWQSRAATLEISQFELKPLVFGVVSQYRLAIAKSKIRLRLRVDAVSILADSNKVRLILDNLISNAVKFTPPNGQITITASVRSDELELIVRDSGPGVAEEDRDRIFEAFFQGKRLQGGPVGGTGIGLSIVNECVQAYRGSVALDDSGPPGACFVVRLPVNQQEIDLALAAND
jgi:two-component system sensor histidine kinase GlrK